MGHLISLLVELSSRHLVYKTIFTILILNMQKVLLSIQIFYILPPYSFFHLIRVNNLARIQRCCTIMGRKETDEMSAAQIFYPCMQAADVFFLKADICQLGMDQRKVNMLARYMRIGENFHTNGCSLIASLNQHLQRWCYLKCPIFIVTLASCVRFDL